MLDSRADLEQPAQRAVGKTTRTHELFDERQGAAPAAAGHRDGTSVHAERELEPHGEGAALDARIKGELEAETGYRLDKVRIHIGGPTARLLAEQGKRGAAKGRHILLAEGAYAPDTAEGKQLIRHELNHVIQQAHGKVASDLDPQRRAGLEAEADRVPAHHGGKELQDLSPPETGPAQFMFMDGGGAAPHHAAAPAHHAPAAHTAPPVGDDHWNDAKRAQAPAYHAPVRKAPVYHAPVRQAPVYHAPVHKPAYHPAPPVGDDHWNDAKRAHTPAHAAPAHHAAPPVGDDHWNDAKRAHAAPVHHAAPPVGDDHWNDAKRAHTSAHAAPVHHAAPPVGDTHWNDANLRGAHVEALAQHAADRGGANVPIVGPALGGVARAEFVAHLSKRDRADLAAYEHSEHVVHDGVDAVKHHQAAERQAAEARQHQHHGLFSLHTLASAGGSALHAGGSALHAGEDLGGKGVHAVVHAPDTIKKAAVGAYHHPLEAGKVLLDAAGVDTADIAESFDDLKHGRIKHFVVQRLKTAAGEMLVHPFSPMPPGIISNGKEDRQVFDDVVHGDMAAAGRDSLKAQVHEGIKALMWLPPARAGKAFEMLGALSKLSKLGKLEDAATAETRIADGAAHLRPHGEAPHGEAPHGEAPHGEAPHGEAPHGEAPHGEAPHGEAPHGEAPHGEAPHGEAPHGEAPHGEAPSADHPHATKGPGATTRPHGTAPHDEAGGPRGSDEPETSSRSHARPHARTIGNEPGGLPATPRVRETLARVGHVLRDGLGLKTTDQASREAAEKARKKILDARVPGGSRQEKTAIRRAARNAAKAAKREAPGELRERQALVVENTVDLAEKLGLKLPPASKELIGAAIRNWDMTAPYLRGLVSKLTEKPRAALRQIVQAWENRG